MSGRCYCIHPGHCPWHHTIVNASELEACRNGNPPQRKSSEPMPCVYLGRLLNEEEGLYECGVYGQCTLGMNDFAEPACDDCMFRLTTDDEKLAERFIDPLKVTDRNRFPTHALRNMLAGRPAFLVCAGPSLKQIDVSRLHERGVFSLGVNNVAVSVRTNAFVCSDPPMKFHNAIWFDPTIMKFLPIPKLSCSKSRGRLRRKCEDGKFRWLDATVLDCPNVWGFERRGWLLPDDTFFTERSASWGNLDEGVQRVGLQKTASTMLLAIRLLYYLGARKIFLLGCDFRMRWFAGETENYAFPEIRDVEAIESNNHQLAVVNEWLCQLRPTFERFGLEIYNCYRYSYLRAFDHVPFDAAIKICRSNRLADEVDLTGWYSKETVEDE